MTAFQGGNLARARAAFEEALGLARELDEAPWVGAAQFMLGQLNLRPTSTNRLGTELAKRSPSTRASKTTAHALAAWSLLAAALAGAGSLEDAARYFGAAETLRGPLALDSFELPL